MQRRASRAVLPVVRHDAATDETRYPAAEAMADSMRLPLVADPVSRELYGTTVPVLDEAAARRALASAGHLVGTPAHDAAVEHLRRRFDVEVAS